jgi:hypothetical protein
VNVGLLERPQFWRHVNAGWHGLLSHVNADGKLGSCQPIGADPRKIKPTDTDLYGSGAFLLAGSEIYKAALAAQGKVRTRARFAPERMDDFIWENDRVAHRAYGPALITGEGTCSAGIDVFLKRTNALVLDKFYKRGDYHRDHGEGLDCYDVGTSQGLGGTVVLDSASKKWVPATNFAQWRLLENGPVRITFELAYPSRKIGERTVTETRRFTLNAGCDFVKVAARFDADGDAPLEVGVALLQTNWRGRFKHAPQPVSLSEKPDALKPAAQGAFWLADWQKNRATNANGKKTDNGYTGVAVIVPSAKTIRAVDGHWLVVATVNPGDALTYHIGSGWSKAHYPTQADWLKAVKKFADGE